MLLIAYIQCGANETKHVNLIILCCHVYNKLCREPQMSSIVLTDSNHTCGLFLDLLLISKLLAHRRHMLLCSFIWILIIIHYIYKILDNVADI